MERNEIIKVVNKDAKRKARIMSKGIKIFFVLFVNLGIALATGDVFELSVQENFELMNATFTDENIIVDNKEFTAIDEMALNEYYEYNSLSPIDSYNEQVYYDGYTLYTEHGFDNFLLGYKLMYFILDVILVSFISFIIITLTSMCCGNLVAEEKFVKYFKNRALKKYVIQL